MSRSIIPEVVNKKLNKNNNIDYNMNFNVKQNYNYSKNYNTKSVTNNYSSVNKGFLSFIFLIISLPFKLVKSFIMWLFLKFDLKTNKKEFFAEQRKYKVLKKIKSRYDLDEEIW